MLLGMADSLKEMTTTFDQTTVKPENEEDEAIEYKIAAVIFKYYSPIQLTIALFGNIMIILVFSRKSMRNTVTSFLFRVLAVADTFMVLVSLVPEAILELGNNSIAYSSTSRCKLHGYIYFAGRTYAVWVLILIVLERFVGVNFPHRASTLITKRGAKMAVFSLLIIVYLLYAMMPFALDSKVITNSNGDVINYYCKVGSDLLRYFTEDIYPVYDLCLYSLIPFVIMMIANVSIIYRLFQARRLRSQSTTNDTNDLIGMTTMLLGISFGFVISTLPYNIAVLYRKGYGIGHPGSYLFYALGAVLANFNHCINFYIYCLTGSKFRREIRKMCCCDTQSEESSSLSNNSRAYQSTISSVA